MDTKIVAFVATSQPDVSQEFYAETLGLKFLDAGPYALSFDINGINLRVQIVKEVVPQPYTAIGFEVADINQRIAELRAKGVQFEQYPFLEQDDSGIWVAPGNVKIAWFKDPDGNTISLSSRVST